MEWYEQNYVNHRDWILDHLELLGLDEEETILVLLIDFLNEKRIPITLSALSKKTGMSSDQVNQKLSVLCAKNYMEIRTSGKHINYVLNGLFSTDTARDRRIMDSSLIDTFETEFGRPLSPVEMQKISDWNKVNEKRMILYALREASAYQKLTIAYVDTLLNKWHSRGLTPDMIEAGKAK